MPTTVNMTKDRILSEEESIKERVYGYFEKKMEESNSAVRKATQELSDGRYETQFASTYASELDKRRRHHITISKEINSLYKKPYFSHIKLFIPEDNDIIHCLLTDCPDLDEVRTVANDKDGEFVIIPFKQDESRKLFGALFSAYQAKNGAPFSVPSPRGGETVYNPEIIRDVTVLSRIIQDVRQFYPDVLFEEEAIDFDDILAQRLDENRDNATLRNIIATLQREQYSIVQTPQDVSFIVQGCAGSGKSQCLIHRLFFLRSVIAERGWDKVLLITPSQLFRNYSAELMSRFRLSSVANTSISELYQDLLFRIDDRFKNRQYRFELSEEYLPDEYLQQVYSQKTINTIRAEIQKAIRSYVNNACDYLNIPSIDDPLSPEKISGLVDRLDREIAAVSLRERERAKDESYSMMREESEMLEKRITALKRTHERLLQRRSELIAKKEQLEKLRDDIDYAEIELADWLEGIQKHHEALKEKTKAYIHILDSEQLHFSSLGTVNAYLISVANYLDAACEWGEKYKADAEHTAFLRSYVELCQEELRSFAKGKSVNALERSYQKDLDDNEKKIADNGDEIAASEQRIEELVLQLTEYTNDENVRNQTRARIEAMEASRYFLSRIESSVFEREIWNVLSPLKEQCGIKTLDIEDLGNGRRKETRILYKSDLLFYLRIYMFLNEIHDLPQYDYICIDEGQDLHKADYETLRELYPNATLNVFGDVDQALHVNCGISNWQKETGIQNVFELRKNYRNTPAVVEFIKERFGAKMESCGKIRDEQAPIILRSKSEIAARIREDKLAPVAVIVKDRSSFEEFCTYLGEESSLLNYIDTMTENETVGMVSCFSVFAAKGLEYPDVLVWPAGMTTNQKVVACSRALNHLYYCDQG